MKEKFTKVKETLNEAIEMLKVQKFDEAIEILSKTADEIAGVETEATQTAEELEKTKTEGEEVKVELEKVKEDMKKWADMYISAESVTKLLEDLKTGFKTDMAKMLEEIKSTPLGSQQMVKVIGGEDKEEGLFDSLMPNG